MPAYGRDDLDERSERRAASARRGIGGIEIAARQCAGRHSQYQRTIGKARGVYESVRELLLKLAEQTDAAR